jgi:hypothetical protein
MDVEITVKVGGQLVKKHVQAVSGTLEQMEETIHALTQQVAGEALQASVDQAMATRPLFRPRAGSGGTAATAGDGSLDSPAKS